MTKTEVATMLAMIAAYDRRTIGETDVEAWHLILEPLNPDDAMQAVKEHYTDSRTWLMPADIHDRATAITRRRIGRARVAELEAELAAETAPPTDDPRSVAALLAGIGRRVAPATKDELDHERRMVKIAEARAELDSCRGGTA